MPRITVLLSHEEELALIELARLDLRLPNVQARFLLREELIRRGVLKTERTSAASDSASSTPAPVVPALTVLPSQAGH